MSPEPHVPPGWPVEVRPPGSPDWQRSAVGWLLDQCPADYRLYPVLSRHPVALVHLASHHVQAQLHGNRQALASVRTRLRELPPPVLTEVVEALEVEQVRLQGVVRSLGLVAQALEGKRFIPRL